MAKYEYLVKYWTNRLNLQEDLNELGADGWKVVGIHAPAHAYILMREY